MPRGLWSGSLSFGLVNVPVQVVSAVRDLDLHFHQLHEEDGARIEIRRFCAEEDKEVSYEDIGRAYDTDDGEMIILTDEELTAAAPEKTRTIDIEAFVDIDDVDPIYFDHPYFLVPTGEGQGVRRAYQLLVEVMSRTERAALGRFVMRTKEYLVLVQVRDGRLALTTLRFHDEVRPAKDVDAGGAKKPAKKALDGAVAVVEALSADWDPSQYRDCYRERLEEVVARKKQGERITVPETDDAPGAVPDLLAALEATLADIKGGKAGKGGAGEQDDDLSKLTKDELYERAQKADVPGRSDMTKDELVDALR